MRVSRISVYHQPNYAIQMNQKTYCPEPCPIPQQPEKAPQFRGKFGAWVGAVVGGVAVVATALVTAPAIVCLAGGGALIGGLGGDMAEDAINGENKK